MRKHVLKSSDRQFPAILEPSQGGHLQATGGARHHNKYGSITLELSGTKLGTSRPLVLGGIIENQNSDFVMQ
jgi:hypothetical protein